MFLPRNDIEMFYRQIDFVVLNPLNLPFVTIIRCIRYYEALSSYIREA